ncbi:MAG: hypothetical protein WD176_04190 [Pirellulales bacterium]
MFQFDGIEPHRSAFDQTALAELLKNDLGPLAADLSRRILNALGPDVVAGRLLAGGRPDDLAALHADAKQLPQVIEALGRRGVLAGVELADGIPGGQLIMVFPGGGADQDRATLTAAVRLAARSANIKVTESKSGARSVLAGTFFGIGRLACWQEGKHFVVATGTIPHERTIAVADGTRKSLADDPRWAEVAKFKDYETYLRGFVDTAQLQQFGARLVSTVKPILAQLGVDGLTNVALHLGFEGRYQRSTILLSTTEKRSGILQLLAEGPSLELVRMPALAPDASTVIALRMSPEAAYRFLLDSVQKITDLVEPGQSETLRGQIADFEGALGGDAMKKTLASLGPAVVGYTEAGSGIPFFGGALAIEVRDSAALEQNRDAVLRALEQAGRETFTLLRREYRGKKLYVFQSKQQFLPFHPTFAVTDGWLHIGLSPQSVKAAIFRATDGRRRLEFVADLRDRVAQRMSATSGDAKTPRKLLAFAQSDPRPSVQVLLGVLPLFSSVLGATGADGGFFQKLDPTVLPTAQAVTESLSPNFWLLTDDQRALRYDSYSTLPMPFDFGSLGAVYGFAALGFGFMP